MAALHGLDDCEHLLPAVTALVARVRGHCPHVAVLATSRKRLRLSGERVWELAPLPVPPAGATAADVRTARAGALFCTRAEAADPGFRLAEDDAPAVAAICRRLDGIPLAIQLVAARTRALTPGDVAGRLGGRFQLLTAGPHGEGDRPRSLEAAADWSYRLLDDRTARLFERRSVFAGPFALAAAEQVCSGDGLPVDDVAGLLADLVDKSLVVIVRPGGRPRYRLLETPRQTC